MLSTLHFGGASRTEDMVQLSRFMQSTGEFGNYGVNFPVFPISPKKKTVYGLTGAQNPSFHSRENGEMGFRMYK